MFKRRGNTKKYNLRIASLLSFIAGIVNVTGYLAVITLTTNVTGHFAFIVDAILKLQPGPAFTFFLYIFFFFFGSFVSNFIIELKAKKKDSYIYIIPAIVESIILFSLAISGQFLISKHPNLLAFSLLFAMGFQNSFVTTISNAAVRTTHLTGLFTDLGIELSQLFFYKHQKQRKSLYTSIKLRLTIICFFFLGGVFGGLLYFEIGLYVLAIAGTILLAGILYDGVKLKLTLIYRKYMERKNQDKS